MYEHKGESQTCYDPGRHVYSYYAVHSTEVRKYEEDRKYSQSAGAKEGHYHRPYGISHTAAGSGEGFRNSIEHIERRHDAHEMDDHGRQDGSILGCYEEISQRARDEEQKDAYERHGRYRKDHSCHVAPNDTVFFTGPEVLRRIC